MTRRTAFTTRNARGPRPFLLWRAQQWASASKQRSAAADLFEIDKTIHQGARKLVDGHSSLAPQVQVPTLASSIVKWKEFLDDKDEHVGRGRESRCPNLATASSLEPDVW
jgi:hypothetical protein